MGPLASSIGYTSLVSHQVFEHEVSDNGFEVPINYRDRSKIERTCAHITIQIRPVIEKIVPKTRPVIIACSTPGSP